MKVKKWLALFALSLPVVALSTSLMPSIDGQHPSDSWGLRVALLVAAAITAVGYFLARRAPVTTADHR